MSFAVEFDEIRASVNYSLQRLCSRDLFLLRHRANERSITHKMADYLQEWYADFDVDCEYNRHGQDQKQLPRECLGESMTAVYPDIVVHLRGEDSTNLLVVEAKIGWNGTVPECDLKKLESFTRSAGQFRYDYGLFISFSRLQPIELVWFSDSNALDRTSAESVPVVY